MKGSSISSNVASWSKTERAQHLRDLTLRLERIAILAEKAKALRKERRWNKLSIVTGEICGAIEWVDAVVWELAHGEEV